MSVKCNRENSALSTVDTPSDFYNQLRPQTAIVNLSSTMTLRNSQKSVILPCWHIAIGKYVWFGAQNDTGLDYGVMTQDWYYICKFDLLIEWFSC